MLVSVRSGSVKPDSQPPRLCSQVPTNPPPPPPSASAAAPATPAAAGLSGHVGTRFLRGVQAAHGAIVLHVAVDLVRIVVIHGHVIHLADRQRDAVLRRP